MTSPRPLLAAAEIAAAVILIVGKRIPGLVYPVRIDARLRQDLGLTGTDRAIIARELERRFRVSADGVGASWVTVGDIANFVERRQGAGTHAPTLGPRPGAHSDRR